MVGNAVPAKEEDEDDEENKSFCSFRCLRTVEFRYLIFCFIVRLAPRLGVEAAVVVVVAKEEDEGRVVGRHKWSISVRGDEFLLLSAQAAMAAAKEAEDEEDATEDEEDEEEDEENEEEEGEAEKDNTVCAGQ